MAGERKDNSVLFSLKELKDITADQPPEPARAKAAQAPARRPSVLDDTDDLLADLRSSVAADAEAEASRVEGERRAQQEESERRIRETSALQRAEIDARIAAEQARRRAAEDERAARARQIDLDERRARGEIIEEDLPPPPAEMPSHAPVQPQVAQIMVPVQPQGRGTGFYLTVVGLPVLCITAVSIALIFSQKDPVPLAPSTEPVIVNLQPVSVAPPVTAPPKEVVQPASVAAAATEPPPDAKKAGKTWKRKPKDGDNGTSAGGNTPTKPRISVDIDGAD